MCFVCEFFLLALASGWQEALSRRLDPSGMDFWAEKVGFVFVMSGTFLYFGVFRIWKEEQSPAKQVGRVEEEVDHRQEEEAVEGKEVKNDGREGGGKERLKC